LHPDEAYSSLSEDLNNDHPEQETERFVSILAECLALMGKLPEAIEVFFRIYFLSYKLIILILDD